MRRTPLPNKKKEKRKAKRQAERAELTQVRVWVTGRRRTDPGKIHKYELENIRKQFRKGFTNKELMAYHRISKPTLFRYYKRIGGLTMDDKSEHYKQLHARVMAGDKIL